jgi:hypothetical protein
VARAVTGSREAFIGRQRGTADAGAQACELAVVADSHEDRIGARAQGVIGVDIRMRVTGPLGNLAVHEPVGGMRVKQRQPAVVQRCLDELAAATSLPFLQGQQHADHRIESGHHVDHRQAHAQRAAAYRRAMLDLLRKVVEPVRGGPGQP